MDTTDGVHVSRGWRIEERRISGPLTLQEAGHEPTLQQMVKGPPSGGKSRTLFRAAARSKAIAACQVAIEKIIIYQKKTEPWHRAT